MKPISKKQTEGSFERVIDYVFLIGILAFMQAWSSRRRSCSFLGKTAVVHHACDIAISLIMLHYIRRTAREVRMTTHTGHLKITYEDYRLIPGDGKRHEVIDGEHVMSPSPSTKHQRIARTLLTTLTNFLRDHPLGEIFIAPYDVVLSDVDVVQPDLVFVATAQAAIVTEANIRGVPTLVVEILSEGNRRLDETIKRHRYEHYGIPEYWILDPELAQVKIYRLIDGRYGQAAVLTMEAQDTLTTPLLPNLSLPLATLFT